MATYRYTAVNRAGELQKGRLDAPSTALAAESLARQSLLPVQLQEAGGFELIRLWPDRAAGAAKAGHRDVLLLTQQLAALTRAGLTLDRALSIALQLAETPAYARLLESLLSAVRRGRSFSEALEPHRAAFPGYFMSMVRAGEASGALPEILERLGRLLQRTEETRQKVLSALIYPAILLAMIGLTLLLVVGFVLPRFEALFAEAGSRLPLATRVVMAFGHIVQEDGVVLALVLLAGIGAARRAWSRPSLRLRFDAWVLRQPWLGPALAKAESARFARTLGTLTGGGLPVPDALRIAAGALYNQCLRQAVAEVLRHVSAGEGFAGQLERGRLFPALLVQMARVGEETGRLPESLLQAADMLDADAQQAVERGLTVAVPLITVLMGALVAGLIGSVLVGILSINDLAT